MQIPEILSNSQVSLLIRLLLSHIFADFMLQNKWMTLHKSWKGPGMMLHIFVVIIITGLFTQYWIMSAIIGLAHYLIDTLKQILLRKKPGHEFRWFITDQAFHVINLLAVWSILIDRPSFINDAIDSLLSNQKSGIIILGFSLCIWPWGYFTGYATRKLIRKQTEKEEDNIEEDIRQGGRLIGIFERIIILTFVLLQQYEAIGFLIAGKSLLRLNTKKQTEYVLAGTLLSYAMAILTGVLINCIIKSPS